MKVRKHIYFSGQVQGVGFRYHAYRIATALGLTGWVQNLYDDRVEMEVQGEERVIWDMVSELHKQRFIQIDDMDVADMAVKPEGEFRIAN